jgi:hypothetical protein
MTTNKTDVAPVTSTTPAAPPPQGSSARLLVLLGLLAIVIGAYAYDYFVARPGVEAVDKRIQDFVDTRNKMDVRQGSVVTPDDLHKELKMQPTFVQKHDDHNYKVEYYCWWGQVPYLNTRRHFISVVYYGNNPGRFSSHHREHPPAEALPINETPTDDPGALPEPRAADAPPPEGKREAPAEAKDDATDGAPDAPAAKDKD